MPNRPRNDFDRYHAHIYFDEGTEAQARDLCVKTWQNRHVGLGRFHQRPVGPHPVWSCQLSFDRDEFDGLIPWLDEQRGNLDILVHPLTGDDLADHTTLATWLGDEVDLVTSIFEEDTEALPSS